MNIKKPGRVACGCCLRPYINVYDNNKKKIGSIQNEFACI